MGGNKAKETDELIEMTLEELFGGVSMEEGAD